MSEQLQLSPEINQGLQEFVNSARGAFGDDLLSVVLFGSAAEGRLRKVSDINLILVLNRFDRQKADMVREPLRLAHASIRLDVMFLLVSEIEQAMEAFAVKFSDIMVRRRVLFGPDPFSTLTIPPDAVRRRTVQTLLNIMIRLRNRYVLVSLREEKLAVVAAETVGSLRACALSLLSLEGREAASPREALAIMLSEMGMPNPEEIERLIDNARREGFLPAGSAANLLFSLMAVAEAMHRRLSDAESV